MHLIHAITSLRTGGAEYALVTLIDELQVHYPQLTHEVWYFVDGPMRAELTKRGVIVVSLAGVWVRYSPYSLVTRISERMRLTKPIGIHSSLWATNWLMRWICWYTKIPLIASVHSPPDRQGVMRSVLDWCAPHTWVTWTAVSSDISEYIKHLYGIGAPVYTITNGVRPTQLQARAARPAPDTQTLHIGAVGRLVASKNFDLLIQAVCQLHDTVPAVHLTIIGDGPERARLTALIAACAAQQYITLAGELSARDWYHHFDIFAQPSSYEGLSLALLEALSAQLPVIVTGRYQKHPIITHQETGLIISPTIPELVEAILVLATQPEQALRIAHAGHQLYTQQYTAAHMASRYAACYEITYGVKLGKSPQLLQ